MQGLNGWLAEPRWKIVSRWRGTAGICIEGKSPVDIDEALGICFITATSFQTAPTFPFAERKEQGHVGRRDGV